MRNFLLVTCSGLVLWQVGCFQLDRTQGIAPGDIAGRAVRVDLDEGAAFVKVSTVGTSLLRSGDADGAFGVSGLPSGRFDLRLIDDKNGDGWTDRGAIATGILAAQPDGRAGFVLLGDVNLAGSFGLRGQALQLAAVVADPPVPVGADFVVRVYALRGSCLPITDDVVVNTGGGACGADDITNRVELGNDGETAADSLGAWQLTRLQAGTVDLVALLFALKPDGSVGAVVDVEGPTPFVGVADGNAEPRTDGPTFVFDGVPMDSATVQLLFTPDVAAGAFAVFAPPGTVVGSCEVARSTVAPAIVTDIAAGNAAIVGDLPPGPYDVVVCSGTRRGALIGPVALPTADDALPAQWPVLLLAGDPCPDGVDVRDCDSDGRPALPLSRIADLRVECAASCFPAGAVGDSIGANLGDRTCSVGTETFDCDDDADGQPDVTEPTLCIGIGRGTDLDGDGLCSTSDPFPHCAANNASACVAGAEDLSPTLVADAAVNFFVVYSGPTVSAALVGTAVVVTKPDNEALVVLLGIADGDAAVDEIVGIDLNTPGIPAVESFGTYAAAGLQQGPRVRVATLSSATNQPIIVGGFQNRSGGNVVFDDVKTLTFAETKIGLAATFTNPGAASALALPVCDSSAVILNQSIAVVGGRTMQNNTETLVDNIQLYELQQGGSPSQQTLAQPRALASVASLLIPADFPGLVHLIVMGGERDDGPTAVVETFSVSPAAPLIADSVPVVPNLNAPHSHHTFHALTPPGAPPFFVVIGGDGSTTAWEVWHQGDQQWTSNELLIPRTHHASVVLPDGKILLVGGNDGAGRPLPSTEVLDPNTNTSFVSNRLIEARRDPSAVIVGLKVLIAGGFDDKNKPLATTEIFEVIP